MTPENIYYVFNVKPHEQGHIERVLLGKFSLDNGKFEILEDHGMPKGLAEMTPADAAEQIHRLTSSMYYEVVNMHDMINGLHPELLKDVTEKEKLDDDIKTVISRQATKEPPSGEFEYDRVGGEGPRVLSVSDGHVFLDGHLLTHEEIGKVKEHISTGKAFLRNRLKKSEPGINTDNGMDKILNEDSSVPGVGNLRAYNEFTKNKLPGMYVHINAHDIGDINNKYGHETGHRAVRAVGTAINHIARSLAGKDAHVFRPGGDKFVVHIPTAEGAALFARGLRQHLEGVPAVRGTHRLSISAGIGPTKDHAQWALHDSTTKKNQVNKPKGQSQNHISIRMPSSDDTLTLS